MQQSDQKLLVLFSFVLIGSCASTVSVRYITPAPYKLPISALDVAAVQGADEVASALEKDLVRSITRRGNGFSKRSDCPTGTQCSETNATIKAQVLNFITSGGTDRFQAVNSMRASVLVVADNGTELFSKEYHAEAPNFVAGDQPNGTQAPALSLSSTDMEDDTMRPSPGVFDSVVPSPIFANTPRTRIIRQLTNSIAWQLMRDIEPRPHVANLTFDDSRDLRPGVQLAAEGNYTAAEDYFSDVLQRRPDTAGALYNLGVLAEVQGDGFRAGELYTRADALDAKTLYRDTLVDFRKRHRLLARSDER
jgi:hypothetical protein